MSTLFMVSGSEAVDRIDQHRTFVDAAAEAGVQHIVYTSLSGAAADSIFTHGRDHHGTEQHILASGLRHTFLRDSFYLDVLPDPLTQTEVAAIISAVRGQTVTFHDETVEEAYESRRRWDAPDWLLDAWVSTYSAIAAGEGTVDLTVFPDRHAD